MGLFLCYLQSIGPSSLLPCPWGPQLPPTKPTQLSMLAITAATARALVKRSTLQFAYSIAVAMFALPFWIWAVINSATGSFDLGAVSFASVIAWSAAVNLLPVFSFDCQRLTAGGSCALVSANYI